MKQQSTLHRSEFVKRLRAAVPEVEPFLTGYRDNLTMELLALTLFTRDAIASGRHEVVARTLLFVDSAYRSANARLKNALAVSYLEHLDFSGPHGREAAALLSPLLADARRAARVQLQSPLAPTP